MVCRITKAGCRPLGWVVLFCIAQCTVLPAQKYYAKTARIQFVSDAPLEKIEASNHNGLVVFDAATGAMEWSVLIKGFQFEKAMMQEHFNENYLESHKFPKGLFKGTVLNMPDINLQKNGTYRANVSGDLTLHGVTKAFIANGQLTVKDGNISATSTFDLVVADFNIEIPKLVRDNIAKTVKVSVSADLLKMK